MNTLLTAEEKKGGGSSRAWLDIVQDDRIGHSLLPRRIIAAGLAGFFPNWNVAVLSDATALGVRSRRAGITQARLSLPSLNLNRS